MNKIEKSRLSMNDVNNVNGNNINGSYLHILGPTSGNLSPVFPVELSSHMNSINNNMFRVVALYASCIENNAEMAQ